MRDNLSAKSFFTVSKALFKENVKIYMYIPIVSLVMYFVIYIFPFILNIGSSNSLAQYMVTILDIANPGTWVLGIIIPFVSSILVMSYYHKPEKAMMLHSQPFSRAKLFNSHVLSGWLMIVVPMIIISLMLLAILPTMTIPAEDAGYSSFYSDASYIKLTAGFVMRFILISVAINTFYYGMFILAASFAGNSGMNILLNMVFMGIIPVTIYVFNLYCVAFMKGYDIMPDWLKDLMVNTNPVLFKIEHSGLNNSAYAYYFIAGVIMLILASLACHAAKLEKVGDMVMFKVVEEIITALIVFCAASGFGIIFYYLSYKMVFLYIGMIIGLLLALFIVKVVVNRSIKIFNKDSLKSLVISLVILAVLVSFTLFDIGGYKKVIPDLGDIKSVEMNGFTASYNRNGSLLAAQLEKSNEVSDEEFIGKVLELQKYIVENKLYNIPEKYYEVAYYSEYYLGEESGNITINNYPISECEPAETIKFSYKMNDGRVFSRVFTIILTDEVKAKLDEITSMDEFAEAFKTEGYVDINKVERIAFWNGKNGSEIVVENKDRYKDILEAYDRDISDLNYTNSLRYNMGYIASEDEDYCEMTLEYADVNYGYVYMNQDSYKELRKVLDEISKEQSK